MVSEYAGVRAITSGHIDAGVSTRFVWMTGWTPHPLLEQGSIVRESVAIWPQQTAPLSGLLAMASPHPRPVRELTMPVICPCPWPVHSRVHKSVHIHIQSVTVTAVSPCPRTIHIRAQAATVDPDCP